MKRATRRIAGAALLFATAAVGVAACIADVVPTESATTSSGAGAGGAAASSPSSASSTRASSSSESSSSSAVGGGGATTSTQASSTSHSSTSHSSTSTSSSASSTSATSGSSSSSSSSGAGGGLPTTCTNGHRDGDETDVDCGGSCGPCFPGLNCKVDGDCDASLCKADRCDPVPFASWTSSPKIGNVPWPPTSVYASMYFDTSLDKAVLLGGSNTSTQSLPLDSWQWGGASAGWVDVPVDIAMGPNGRSSMQLGYDATKHVLYMFGGYSQGGPVQDMWTYDATQGWKQLSASNPPSARYQASAAFDSLQQRFTIFGGQTTTTLADDMYFFTKSWTKAHPSTKPPALADQGFVEFSPGTLYFFGGEDSMSPIAAADRTWKFDGTTWTDVSPVLSPPHRYQEALVYDARRKRLIISGGADDTAILDDVWEFDGTTWERVLVPSHPRVGHAAAFDTKRGVLVTYGGVSALGVEQADISEYVAWGNACSTSSECDGTFTCVDKVCCTTTTCPAGNACNVPNHSGTCTASP